MLRTFLRALTTLAAVAVVATLVGSLSAVPEPAKPAPAKPKVEVVFCLDTTGSMGGLIDGAKQKIWAICNQIAGGKPIPDLKVGLVAFRDRGDEYITKVFELSEDLDAIHGELKKFTANGGGDAPESVNQALDDSVNKIKWSTDKKTLRIIFLVGDAPPHMDYKDDVKYPVTCKKAAELGIIINTIQCGTDAECTKFWKDIASKAEGSYAAIPQEGGVVAIATPFDKRLGELNNELAKTTLVFGAPLAQNAARLRNDAAKELKAADAAERVAYQAKNGQVCAFDFLDNIKQGKVKFEDLKKEELPPELQKFKTTQECKNYLADLDKKRAVLNKEVIDLDKQRNDYITKKQVEEAKKGKGAFDREVLEILRNQAKKNHIEY